MCACSIYVHVTYVSILCELTYQLTCLSVSISIAGCPDDQMVRLSHMTVYEFPLTPQM